MSSTSTGQILTIMERHTIADRATQIFRDEVAGTSYRPMTITPAIVVAVWQAMDEARLEEARTPPSHE